jgi:hypothetical protein
MGILLGGTVATLGGTAHLVGMNLQMIKVGTFGKAGKMTSELERWLFKQPVFN